MAGLSETSRTQPIGSIALVSQKAGRVCDLAGFRKKNHQVPTEVSDYTRAFVTKISDAELAEDLDVQFAEFRRHFRFRRAEMEVQDPGDGCAAILTPWFEYRISISQDDEDPAVYVFKRQVNKIVGPEELLSDEFAKVFGDVFNSIEVSPPATINMEEFIDSMEDLDKHTLSIDFDRTATWCQLSIVRVPGELLVETDQISLVLDQAQPPTKLLDAFFQFREELKDIEF